MTDYQILYNSWKSYVSNNNSLNEVSKVRAKQILDWIARSMPEDYSFDNLFGSKMRLMIPIEFDQKNIPHGRGSIIFKDLLKLIDRSSIWKYDYASLSRGNVYKINESKDFGAELNLKRYKKETPPSPKRVEKKIGKFLRSMTKSKNWIGDKTFKKVLQTWEEKGDKIFCPQGSIIISRHPIDVARMSDFKNLQSCHTPGSDFYKCAIKESMGNAPVAYFVSKKQIENLFAEEEIEDISELDKKEILHDTDRDIQGLSPTSRLRLRKFSGFNNDGNGFELAVPEIRSYGNDISHFRQTINNWALNNQLTELSEDIGDIALLKNKAWREEYLEAWYDYQHFEDIRDEAGMSEAQHKMIDIVERITAIFPDMEKSFKWGGGTYIDTPPKKLFLNFLGIQEIEYKSTKSSTWSDVHAMNIFSEDFVRHIVEDYNVTDGIETDEDLIRIETSNTARDMYYKLYKFYEDSGIESQKDFSAPEANETDESSLDYNQMSPFDFYRNLKTASGAENMADVVGMTSSDILAGIDQYNEMIKSLKQMADGFSNFIINIKSLEEMLLEGRHNDQADDIIKMAQENNYRFEMKIGAWMGDIFIEPQMLPEIIGAGTPSPEVKILIDGIKDIIESIGGRGDMLQSPDEYGWNRGPDDMLAHFRESGMTSEGFKFSWKWDKEDRDDGYNPEVSIIFFFKTHIDADRRLSLSIETKKKYEEIITACLRLDKSWHTVKDNIIRLFENEREVKTEDLIEGIINKVEKQCLHKDSLDNGPKSNKLNKVKQSTRRNSCLRIKLIKS
ncbi:hypothetical protein OAT10_00095 [Luminiphilus sp.]|nr:hypothetical protein [Luminiphilus sp.]